MYYSAFSEDRAASLLLLILPWFPPYRRARFPNPSEEPTQSVVVATLHTYMCVFYLMKNSLGS